MFWACLWLSNLFNNALSASLGAGFAAGDGGVSNTC